MIKAYKVAKEILHKRTSPYEDIKAEALIMLEKQFPIFTGDPNEVGLGPEDYSNHDIHDLQHGWPFNLFSSMPIEAFALHITKVGEERISLDWIESVWTVSRFMEPGNLFSAGLGYTYMKTDDVRIVELINGARVPFNYTTVGGDIEMVWTTVAKLKECVYQLSGNGLLASATKSTSMDNELRLSSLNA